MLKFNWPLITLKRHKKIMQEITQDYNQTEDQLRDQRDMAYDMVLKADETAAKYRQDYLDKAREVFWNLAHYGAIIKTTYHSGYNNYFQYSVYFHPALAGPNGVQNVEAILQDRLIKGVGVPGWEYIEGDRMLKKTYGDLDGILRAPEDIKTALEHLNKHLANLLKERTYQEILRTEAKDQGIKAEPSK